MHRLLRPLQFLNGSNFLAPELLVKFMDSFDELRRQIVWRLNLGFRLRFRLSFRLLGHGVRNAPPDHRDLQGVVSKQA